MKSVLKLLFLIILPLFMLTGCKGDNMKPFIVFSDKPITENTVPKQSFRKGSRIYYAAVNPKGFNDKVIKIQIFKKDEKTPILGYGYHSNKDYKLTNQNYYTDYVVIHGEGYYIMQVFEITNLQKPVIMGEFWVADR